MEDAPVGAQQRHQRRLEGLALLAHVLGAIGAVSAIYGVLGFLAQRWVAALIPLVGGLALLATSIVFDRHLSRRQRRARELDDLESRARGERVLPFGMSTRDGGVVFRANALARVALPMLTAGVACLFFLVGALTDAWTVAIIGLAPVSLLLALSWLARTEEVCMDDQGVWRRHVPRKTRLAWRDLTDVELPRAGGWGNEHILTFRSAEAVEAPSGRRRDTFRVRTYLLQTPLTEIKKWAESCAAQPADGKPGSGFSTWT
ncbi:MAG TPA: hypothetical protein PLA46_12305 [Phycicoccus sp.]|jgi:membrane protein implicated in regulation of membrane protease activity|nr:hypothetical protein [Phycicoccus sp.]HQY96047.1 hypothetical protein [Phycicoccus sp.]HRA44038.1 hypothetical protein [Phycicoccus sp.]